LNFICTMEIILLIVQRVKAVGQNMPFSMETSTVLLRLWLLFVDDILIY